MASPDTQHDLLLGHLALELNFIAADTLNAAKTAWSAQKSKSLGQILVDRQAISPHTLGVLENLVQLQLTQDASEDADGPVVGSDATMRGEVPILAPPDEPKPEEGDAEGPVKAPLRFRKVRPHAAGALGQVYLARDKELRRKVALKEIKDRYADNPDARSRFLLEAEITGRLEHPGVVPVYGMGAYDNGRPFYAMRFIKGQSLADAIKDLHAPGRSASEFALELHKLLIRFIEVCNTMQYAHDHDIVHRDIKPSNIMLGTHGETLVVDWGLAKVLGKMTAEPNSSIFEPLPASGSSETLPGRAVGTITYMSPEQAAGRLEEVGPASDVYSLGATLFSILTGRASVEDSQSPDQSHVDMRKLQRKVLEGRIHRPRDIKPEVDRALEAICKKCMALSALDRYKSSRAVADDLQKWLANEPVSAWPEPINVRARRWVAKNRTFMASMAAVVVGVLVATMALSSYLYQAYNEISTHAEKLQDQINKTEAADKGKAVAEAAMLKAQLDEAAAKVAYEKQQSDLEKASKELDAKSKELKQKEQLVFLATQEADTKSKEAKKQQGLADSFRTQADEAQKNLTLAVINEKKAATEFKRTLAVNTTMLAQNRWNEGQVMLANELLEAVDAEFRLGGWHYLRREFEGSYATLYGHTAPVRYVALSPDGRYVASATASRDDKDDGKAKNKGGTLKIWDAHTGKDLYKIEGVSLPVFSPNGKVLAAVAPNGTIKLIDPSKGEVVKTSAPLHKEEITALVFSPDGKRLYSASEGGEILACDADSFAKPANFKVEKERKHKIVSLALNLDGSRLVSTGSDNSVIGWDVEKLDRAFTFAHSTNGLAGAVFAPSGSQLATAMVSTGKLEESLKVWDPVAVEERQFRGQHLGRITHVIYSPDGQRVASASFDGTIKIWDARRGTELQTLQGHTKPVMHISFSPDGQRLASASSDWTVKLWDLSGGAELQPFTGAMAAVSCLAYSPDDKMRLVAGTWGGALHIWNGKDAKDSRLIKAHTKEVLAVAFSADGTRVVSAGQDGKIKLWDAATGNELPLNIKGHTAAVLGIAISRDGKSIASASDDRSVKIWDAQTGAETWSFKLDANEDPQPFTSVAFSPDSKRLVWADKGGTVRVRDIKTNKEVFTRTAHSYGLTGVTFAPTDDYVASAGQDGRVIIWDAKGNIVLTLKGHAAGVMSMSFSTDGKRLATASKDGTVKLWDARTGQAVKTFQGHNDLVTSVVFSPDGMHLVSASLDKTIKLWDASTAKANPVFKGQHARPVESVSYSADGQTVFSRDQADKVVAWNVKTGQPLLDAKVPAGAVASSVSPDRKKLALPVASWFYLVDLEITPQEMDLRTSMSRLKPWLHRDRANQIDPKESAKEKLWYAAGFHWGWVLRANPADAEARRSFDEALKHLNSAEVGQLRSIAGPTVQ